MKRKKEAKAKITKIEASLSDSHPGHESHICHLTEKRKMQTIARLSKDAKFICFICGRAAKSKNNLCSPMEIKLDYF